MPYQIKCAYVSHTGNIRANNEDNFWCAGHYLNEQHDTTNIQTITAIRSAVPVFAVFDGMGGGSSGETASYLAAKEWDIWYHEKKQNFSDGIIQMLQGGCQKMNLRVSRYASEKRIGTMGTTAALIAFDLDAIYICNVGDSRIYHHYNKTLRMISTDHVATHSIHQKAPLTQYIGMDQESLPLEPSTAKGTYHKGDGFLLCSDGLTDMLGEDEIVKILNTEVGVADSVEELLNQSLIKGGIDNVTIILCRVEKKGFW